MPDVEWIRDFCLSFPDATEDMPWAEDLCFKVRGKIFTGLALSDGRFPRVTLKCSPETFHELLEAEGITPAPYVGRYQWVQIASSNLLPTSQLEQLIRHSYALVEAGALGKPPKAAARARRSKPVRAASRARKRKTKRKLENARIRKIHRRS
jgi:predicted DNA-binding protein (MmcQ/YjbR family)